MGIDFLGIDLRGWAVCAVICVVLAILKSISGQEDK